MIILPDLGPLTCYFLSLTYCNRIIRFHRVIYMRVHSTVILSKILHKFPLFMRKHCLHLGLDTNVLEQGFLHLSGILQDPCRVRLLRLLYSRLIR